MRLERFNTPAFVNDFPHDARKQRELAEAWSKNLNRWTETAILGDPWSSVNDQDRRSYYNPLTTELASGVTIATAPIEWKAFPNRINHFFPDASQRDRWSYADNKPPDFLAGGGPYTPAGFRGWQDEYCEWSVTRNTAGKITKVMFTCENAEYWFTLWHVSPDRVLELYRELVSPDVKLEELYLRGADSSVVIDPETNRPAYDALNKWNNSTTNGAVHLVSPPNTLGAEIYLAAAATLLREHAGKPIIEQEPLINCSRYGSTYRNSDPFIGSQVNGLVRAGNRVTLKDPVGLYIQEPEFGVFRFPRNAPTGAKVSDCWRVVRGSPGMGLHVVFEVPPQLGGFTVSDILVNGQPIEFGSQIVEQIHIRLTGQAIPDAVPGATECQAPRTPALPSPQVLQAPALLHAHSRSNLAPRIAQGSKVSLAVVGGDMKQRATAVFPGAGIIVHKTAWWDETNTTMMIQVEVAADAPLGDRALLITNPDGAHGPAAPGMLEVVAAGSIPGAPVQAPEALPGNAKSMTDAARVTPTRRGHRRSE